MAPDWDETSPADDAIVSSFPANERAARDGVKDIFDVDHHSANDANQGKHDQIRLTDLAGDATAAAGQIAIWNDTGTLKGRVGTGTAGRFDALPGVGFATGTKLLFPQSAAPTGWTQDTDVNDRVIRVVNGGGTGGATGGSWTISGVTVDGHTLTIDEMPAHTHPYTVPSGTTAGSLQRGDTPEGGTNEARTTSSTGGGNSHNHGLTADGTWRPSYLDIIKASKD